MLADQYASSPPRPHPDPLPEGEERLTATSCPAAWRPWESPRCRRGSCRKGSRRSWSSPRELTMRTWQPMRQFLSMIAPSMWVPRPTPSGGRPLLLPAAISSGAFVEVVAHQDRVADRHVAADQAAQADDAVLDHGALFDLAAVGDQAAADRGPVDPRGRQEAGAAVDRRVGDGQVELRLRPSPSPGWPRRTT